MTNLSTFLGSTFAGATGAQGPQGATGPVAGSANQVVYKDDTNTATGSANLTFDGTNLNVTGDATVSSLNDGALAGFRNKIINGAMELDQRNSGNPVTLNNVVGLYGTDRWNCAASGGAGTGTATVQRVTDAPSGFRTSLKYTVTNAKSPAANDSFYIYQSIEGVNVLDFLFGTAAAKTITLSFWVKCSLTGTFGGFFRSYNGTTYRSYVFNYTINAANTWQYVTVTATGDTAQAPANDTSMGFGVLFDLGSGSTVQTSTLNQWQTGNYLTFTTAKKLISTLNATFQVTGVQLEVGSVATPFERRNIQQEYALCQRYYWSGSHTVTTWNPLSQNVMMVNFPVYMRATPTITWSPIFQGNVYSFTASAFDLASGRSILRATGAGQAEWTGILSTSAEL